MRPDNRTGEGECYQVNSKVRATYDNANRQLTSLRIDNQEVSNSDLYSICLQGYHFKNSEANLNLTNTDLLESGESKVVSTSIQHMLEEYLRNHQNIGREVEGRLNYVG
jgi:5'-nucleotidase